MATNRPRAVHLRWRYLGLVFLGGTAGTALRQALGLLLPPVDLAAGAHLPLTTLGINVLGALLLGLLLEALVRPGPDAGGRRSARLLLGTGLLGGFTTYSALATDSALLLHGGAIGAAIGYALGTVLLGGLATWLGIVLGAALHRRAVGGGASARGENG
ncbi:CrcB family protein [Cryobacterium serini]|uniref:Fluoride-specific ion channel FluC n=1 Tax=Cryobacterium serini TaxID=1259201 RepID=A0A4R9BKB6_9MICO|nr:CrcB family protein [Cryobacterium serini]